MHTSYAQVRANRAPPKHKARHRRGRVSANPCSEVDPVDAITGGMIASYLIRRAIGFVFVLFGLSVVIFIVARVVPGDPARIALGPLATHEQVAQLQQEMGFDKPAAVQYLDYVRGVLHGDLGKSLLTNRPVSADIAEALPATF